MSFRDNITQLHNGTVAPTELNCQFSLWTKFLFCIMLMSTGICGIVENLFFCVVVSHNKKLHKKSMILLVSLSISDILVSLCVPMIEFFFVLYYPRWPLGNIATYVYNGVWMFSIVSPFMTITAISVERYLAITKRNLYVEFSSLYSIGTVVFLLWIYSLSWVAILVTNFNAIALSHRYIWNVPHKMYYAFLWIHVVVPMVTVPSFNYLIVRHVKLSRKEIQSPNSTIHQNYSSDVRLAGTVIYVVVFLYVVWTPVLILETVYTDLYDICTVKKLDILSVWFASCNCCINPVIYSRRNPEIRKYTRKIGSYLSRTFCCMKENKQFEEEEASIASSSSVHEDDHHKYRPL